MSHLYASLTPLSAALLFLVLGTLGAVALLAVCQRWLARLRFSPDSGDYGQIYGGAIGTIFALIFAFAIVAVWQNYDRVSAGVDQEANALHNVYRTLDAYPEPVRSANQDLLRAYVRQVVDVEWPLLAVGQQDPAAHRMITDLNASLTRYRPTPAEIPVHEQMLRLLESSRALRHDRIKSGTPYLDDTMWLSLLLGSGILLVFSGLLTQPSRLQHHLMHGCLGASIGLMFYLMSIYNWPFYGPGSVPPDALRALPDRYWVIR